MEGFDLKQVGVRVMYIYYDDSVSFFIEWILFLLGLSVILGMNNLKVAKRLFNNI